MSNPHEAKLFDVLASRYEVEVIEANGTWYGIVWLVTKSTRISPYTSVGATMDEARDAAYQFVKDRPR